jgi:hypothetical protein
MGPDVGDVEGDPHAAVLGGDRAAAQQAVRVGQFQAVVRAQAQDTAVEQRGLVEVMPGLGERHVVDVRDLAVHGVPGAAEVVGPAGMVGVRGPAEEQLGAVRCGDGVQRRVVRVPLPGQDGRQQRSGAPDGGGGVGRLQADRAERGAVLALGASGVEQDAGAVLLPQFDGLVRVRSRTGEAEAGQQLAQRSGTGRGQLGEGESGRDHRRGRRREGRRTGRVAETFAHGLLQEDERPHRVLGGAHGRGLAEDVVEHLQGQRPAISGAQDVREQAGHVEVALAGEAAVVPAPVQDVHREPGRVGQLEEKDLLGRDGLDRVRGHVPGEDVEAVQAEPEMGMVGHPHDPPGVQVVVDVPAPRQRLVGDRDPVLGGPLGQQPQLLGGQLVVIDRLGGDRRAHQQPRGAQPFHHRELVLGPPQIPGQDLRRYRLEVAERLEQVDAQPQVGGAAADVLRAHRAGDQIVLEDLHTVETGRADGGQLVGQRAAQ